MDTLDGVILWYTPNGIVTKGKYPIHVSRTRQTSTVLMALVKKKGLYYLGPIL